MSTNRTYLIVSYASSGFRPCKSKPAGVLRFVHQKYKIALTSKNNLPELGPALVYKLSDHGVYSDKQAKHPFQIMLGTNYHEKFFSVGFIGGFDFYQSGGRAHILFKPQRHHFLANDMTSIWSSGLHTPVLDFVNKVGLRSDIPELEDVLAMSDDLEMLTNNRFLSISRQKASIALIQTDLQKITILAIRESKPPMNTVMVHKSETLFVFSNNDLYSFDVSSRLDSVNRRAPPDIMSSSFLPKELQPDLVDLRSPSVVFQLPRDLPPQCGQYIPAFGILFTWNAADPQVRYSRDWLDETGEKTKQRAMVSAWMVNRDIGEHLTHQSLDVGLPNYSDYSYEPITADHEYFLAFTAHVSHRLSCCFNRVLVVSRYFCEDDRRIDLSPKKSLIYHANTGDVPRSHIRILKLVTPTHGYQKTVKRFVAAGSWHNYLFVFYIDRQHQPFLVGKSWVCGGELSCVKFAPLFASEVHDVDHKSNRRKNRLPDIEVCFSGWNGTMKSVLIRPSTA